MSNEREYDHSPGRCCWNDGRERCFYPGSISHGTRGDGPWYCHQHFRHPDATEGRRIIEESRSFTPGNPHDASVKAFEYRAPKVAPRLPYVDAEPIAHFEP